MSKFFQCDERYTEALNMFQKKEGVSAIFLFAIMCAGYAACGYLDKTMVADWRMVIGILFNGAISGITIVFAKLNGRPLSTLGLKTGRNRLSIALGGIVAAFYFYNNCLSHLLAGGSLVPPDEALLYTVFFFSVAVCEELVFRGYIGTRIYSLVKSKGIAVVLTGILFVLMHFPYRMTAYGMTLSDFFGNIGWLIDLFVTHTVFSLIYMKTNSLYGAILPHWVSNLAYNLIVH